MLARFRSCIKQPSSRSGTLLSPFNARRASNSSLSTARSIRAAVSNGNVNQAYQFFTKFYDDQHSAPSLPSKESQAPLKSRLMAHVLAHSLYRAGKAQSAASFIKLCMERGIKIHQKTFESTLVAITLPFDHPAVAQRSSTLPNSSKGFSSTVAVGLLNAARKSGHKSHSWMYDRILNALLLQGELLTAALLFATLIKEWNHRRHVKQIVSEEQPSEIQSFGGSPSYESGTTTLTMQSKQAAPAQWMAEITSHIRKALQAAVEGVKSTDRRQDIPALMTLVSLIEDKYHHVPGRWQLLQLMRSIPPELFTDEESHRRTDACLLQLCGDLENTSKLDLASYHILLQYALRDKRQLELGVNVLKHLCDTHVPSLVTYNILLRDLTLLGEMASATSVAHILSKEAPFWKADPQGHAGASYSSPAHRDIVKYLSRRPVVRPDKYTLTALMRYAIANGKSREVSKYAIRLFPSLQDSRDGFWGVKPSKKDVKQAASLSPHIWATTLHSASVSNRLSFAMKVWQLAMHAEKRARANASDSSLYSVEAYTTHLELFLSKFKRFSRSLKGTRFAEMPKERRQVMFQIYNGQLDHLLRVMHSLKDKIVSNSRAESFAIDGRLLQVLVEIARAVLDIEQRLPLAMGLVVNAEQVPTRFSSEQGPFRPRRYLGVLRVIFKQCGEELPQSIDCFPLRDSRESSRRLCKPALQEMCSPATSKSHIKWKKFKHGHRTRFRRTLPPPTAARMPTGFANGNRALDGANSRTGLMPLLERTNSVGIDA